MAFRVSREQYQTVKVVAGPIQVNEATVRRRIKGGDLRAIEIGKVWRIGPDDLDACLDNQATRPAAPINGADVEPVETPEAKDQEN
jgi:hypothetical protein